MSAKAKIQFLLDGRVYTWLVTGGAGFIGSHTVEQLISFNQKVRVLDNFSTSRAEFLNSLNVKLSKENKAPIEIVQGDVASSSLCEESMEGVDFVIHLAAMGSVPQSFQFPQLTHSSNITGFLNVLVAAQKNKIKKMIYASSSAVYGQTEHTPLKEDDVGVPLSPYGLSKLCNEYYSQILERNADTQLVGLRYFNVFGPRQDPHGSYAAVIPKWILGLKRGETHCIYGDGNTIRDFCSVIDVASINILACLSKTTSPIFNVGTGQGVSLLELSSMLCSILKKPERPSFTEERKGDIRRSVADVFRLQNELGVRPQIELYGALQETCAWFLSTDLV